MSASVPMIYGHITSGTAVRLFNAVISSGAETLLQAHEPLAVSKREATKKLVEALESCASARAWFAEGSPWRQMISAARREVRQFMESINLR